MEGVSLESDSDKDSDRLAAIQQYLLHGTYLTSLSKNGKRSIRKATADGQYELDGMWT